MTIKLARLRDPQPTSLTSGITRARLAGATCGRRYKAWDPRLQLVIVGFRIIRLGVLGSPVWGGRVRVVGSASVHVGASFLGPAVEKWGHFRNRGLKVFWSGFWVLASAWD